MQKHSSSDLHDLSFDEYDEMINPPPVKVGFDRLISTELSRRSLLGAAYKGFISVGMGGFIAAVSPVKRALALTSIVVDKPVEFTPVAANSFDTVTVPQGYNWHVVASWGDPLWSEGTAFDHHSRGTTESQQLAIGDNNDGMEIFFVNGRTVLAVNNEYTNLAILHGNRDSGLPENEHDYLKNKAAHGISIFEISQVSGVWQIVIDSPYNRRITVDTPFEITGPARWHDLMKTRSDQLGVVSVGTWNNCGSGRTPWGTFLSCEENFNRYFSSDDDNAPVSPEFKRYGISSSGGGYGWEEHDERFKTNLDPNEPNRAGYVVEIDPLDPGALPKKRTALGRFKHENAEVVIAQNGKVVVYMGDDERGEYLYRFVSSGIYNESSVNSGLLEDGDLFVARFNDDGSGEWLALSPQTTGMSRAEISIFTRMAASKVGATTMDRPEWVAANPLKAEVFCCLTNNKHRGIKTNKGGDAMPAGGPNPRKKNHYGQIVRWIPDAGQHDSVSFSWELFVLAGNPKRYSGQENAGSANINIDNMFHSPDGLHFDSLGGLWIQTDGNDSNKGKYEGMGNNQMLLANTTTGEIKRFLVGPNEAEITGAAWSEDRKTMFVGIQHPGDNGNSTFPGGEGTVPRSSIIAIQADDGSIMG